MGQSWERGIRSAERGRLGKAESRKRKAGRVARTKSTLVMIPASFQLRALERMACVCAHLIFL
jgi:hypothetical protein